MPTVKVESCSDIKQGQYGFSSKIHCGKDGQFYINADATELIGKQVEIEVTEKKSAKGNIYKIAKVLKVIEPNSDGAGLGEAVPTDDHDPRPTLAQFLNAIHELHTAILLLEPDIPATENDVARDRAEQRAKILISAMIAVSDGRIALGGEGDEPF